MKRLITTMIVCFVFCFTSIAVADNLTLNFSWTANDPVEQVEGYKFYQDLDSSGTFEKDTELIATVMALETTLSQNLSIAVGDNLFGLTAFRGEAESDYATLVYDYVPVISIPTNLTLEFIAP